MTLLLPQEAGENARVKAFVDSTLAKNNPINRVIYKNVRESMRNGGGPACLRLRVVLSEEEASAANENFILDANCNPSAFVGPLAGYMRTSQSHFF